MQRFGKIILLILVLSLAFFLRDYHLTQSPPGFYLDEAANGYNAYSILTTAKDEYGRSWPLFFQSFGDWRGGVFIYSLVPLIAWRGLTIEAVRLGGSIWGTLAIAGIFWLGKLITKNYWFGLLAALILTFMPWQIHFSRIGHEANTLPFFMVAIFCFWLKWRQTQKHVWGIILTLSIWLGFFTYQTAKLWIPLLVSLIIFFYRNSIKKNLALLLPWLIGLNLITLAAAVWEKNFPGSFLARIQSLAIWQDQPSILELLSRFFTNYLNHWQWQFLFKTGDLTLRSSSGISSEMLTGWAIFFIIGIGVLIKLFKKNPAWKIILAMIILFPIASSLTMTSPHAIRTFQAAPFFALTIAIGIWWCLEKIKKLSLKFVFIGLLTLISSFEFNHYYQDLLYQYPQRAWIPQHGFDGSLPPAINEAYAQSRQLNKPLFLSEKIEQAYIQGLFFTQSDPQKWQKQKQANFQVVNQPPSTPAVWLFYNQQNEYQINLY